MNNEELADLGKKIVQSNGGMELVLSALVFYTKSEADKTGEGCLNLLNNDLNKARSNYILRY